MEYFIKTKAREYNKDKKAFNKWYGYSSALQKSKKNLHPLTKIAPIYPSKRAKIWCLWIRRHNIIYWCNSWKRSSNVAKKWSSYTNTVAIYNDDNCTFHKPTTPKTSSTSIDAQIQFTIWYRDIPGNPTAGYYNSNRYYIIYPI